MIEEFKSFLDNVEKYTSVGRTPSEPQQILGNDNKIAIFADFWEKYARDLQVLAVVKLHDYEMLGAESKEELAAYIEGLSVMGKFFEICWKERQEKKSPPEPTS